MKLLFREGNLFTSKDQALAHCISQDCKMGAGIALQFRNRFGPPCLTADLKVGDVVVQETDFWIVFHLITKARYFQKPTYETMQTCLERLRDLVVEQGISTLSMPQIGCGLDRLDWNRVEALIRTVFAETKIRITVYILPS